MGAFTFRNSAIDNEDELFDAFVNDFGTFSSRWYMQLGVRYTF